MPEEITTGLARFAAAAACEAIPERVQAYAKTLLLDALACAFAGYEHTMALYRHAVEARYRFFSYGDAMLLARG